MVYVYKPWFGVTSRLVDLRKCDSSTPGLDRGREDRSQQLAAFSMCDGMIKVEVVRLPYAQPPFMKCNGLHGRMALILTEIVDDIDIEKSGTLQTTSTIFLELLVQWKKS